jgi:hypothetical protein
MSLNKKRAFKGYILSYFFNTYLLNHLFYGFKFIWLCYIEFGNGDRGRYTHFVYFFRDYFLFFSDVCIF